MTPRAAAADGDWRLSVPAGTPYDRQVLLQCIRSTVARWGATSVAVGRDRLLIDGGDPGIPCVACGRRAGAVQCHIRGLAHCLRCALELTTVGSEQPMVELAPAATPAAQRTPQRAHRRNAPARRTPSSAI